MSGYLPPGCTQRECDYALNPYGEDDFDPTEDQEPDEDLCDHDDREVDMLTGSATCHRCGRNGWMTAEEINREIARIRAYDRWQRRERLLEPLRRAAAWLRHCFRRPRKPSDLDDEIPF